MTLPIIDAAADSSTPTIDAALPTFEPSVPREDLIPARLVTLGCKVNQYETEYVRELLFANGYRAAAENEPCELAVVNTCTVTAESDKKSRQTVSRLRRDNPGCRVVVMGCYATADPDRVKKLEGVAAVITDKRDLAAALRPFGVVRAIDGVRSFAGKQRAFLKVQDGCLLDCSFCIIPKVRPHVVSRSIEEIAREAQGLVDAGYRELVLCGIHLGHYGLDPGGAFSRGERRRLWHLLERLAQLDGHYRLRLSSLEATEVNDDLARVMADHADRVCPHLHLSLQSGSDRVLAAMKRRYRIGRFLDRCDRLRSRLDQPAFTTDIIVGFPGETEEDFQATLAAARQAGFCKIHVFPYSPRQGTAAALATDHVPISVRDERRDRLMELDRELAGRYFETLLGRRLEMLVESPDPQRSGWMRGQACRAAPLRLETLPVLAWQLVSVRATRIHQGAIDVEPVLDSAN